MMNYKEIYTALLKLCKNENLRLVEAELEDEIIYLRLKDKVILNRKIIHE